MPNQKVEFKWHWFLDWVPLTMLASALIAVLLFLDLDANLRSTLIIAVCALCAIVGIGAMLLPIFWHGLRWIIDGWTEPPFWFRLIWFLAYYVGVLLVLILERT